MNWFDMTPLPVIVFPVTLLSMFSHRIQAHCLLHMQPILHSKGPVTDEKGYNPPCPNLPKLALFRKNIPQACFASKIGDLN